MDVPVTQEDRRPGGQARRLLAALPLLGLALTAPALAHADAAASAPGTAGDVVLLKPAASVVYLNGTDTVLEDTELLAAALRGLGDRCAVMFLTDDAREAVFAEVTDPTLELAYTGRRVGGFNFSNGRWYDLGVYTARRRTSP